MIATKKRRRIPSQTKIKTKAATIKENAIGITMAQNVDRTPTGNRPKQQQTPKQKMNPTAKATAKTLAITNSQNTDRTEKRTKAERKYKTNSNPKPKLKLQPNPNPNPNPNPKQQRKKLQKLAETLPSVFLLVKQLLLRAKSRVTIGAYMSTHGIACFKNLPSL